MTATSLPKNTVPIEEWIAATTFVKKKRLFLRLNTVTYKENLFF